MKDGVLSQIGIQAEESFAGSGLGLIHNVTGLREFEPDWSSNFRSTKVSVWRTESAKADFGDMFEGRMDLELSSDYLLLLLFGNLMTMKSQTEAEGYTSTIFRAHYSAPVWQPSLRFYATFDNGPWQIYGGVVLKSARLTIRAGTLAHLSLDWTAREMTEFLENPGWSINAPPASPLVGSSGAIQFDDTAMDDAIELSFSVAVPRGMNRMDRSGLSARATGQGPTVISGNLVQYFETTRNLPSLVRNLTAFKIAASVLSVGGYGVVVTLPRCSPSSGQATPTGQQDVMAAIPFRALTDSAQVEESEIEVEIRTAGGSSTSS